MYSYCAVTLEYFFELWVLILLILLQYKEAYDRELMQHGNTMQELVMVKQQLETEQESLAEADEAVKVAEEKLAANDVRVLHQ